MQQLATKYSSKKFDPVRPFSGWGRNQTYDVSNVADSQLATFASGLPDF